MSDYDVRMVILSTDDLDDSIRFYSETLGMTLKFRDGAHYAALDGGSITLALATSSPIFALAYTAVRSLAWGLAHPDI